MSEFRKGQAVREKATGKRWWITATYPRSVTAQHNFPKEETQVSGFGTAERVFKRDEIRAEDVRNG